MILILFIIGSVFIIFGVVNLAKEKMMLARLYLFVGIILFFLGYVVIHLYPQTLPEFFRTFRF